MEESVATSMNKASTVHSKIKILSIVQCCNRLLGCVKKWVRGICAHHCKHCSTQNCLDIALWHLDTSYVNAWQPFAIANSISKWPCMFPHKCLLVFYSSCQMVEGCKIGTSYNLKRLTHKGVLKTRASKVSKFTVANRIGEGIHPL